MVEDLSKYRGCLKSQAHPSNYSWGRERPLEGLEVELAAVDPFARDKAAILESKCFRRLGDKTQVFAAPLNPHIRNRSDHTHEVMSASLWITKLTGLNSELAQAIAAGHDIGHVPYGHLGEDAISKLTSKPFRHEAFGVIVAREIEKRTCGLNLAYETLLGIRWHSGRENMLSDLLYPQECDVVYYADKIAYLFADINDIKRLEFPVWELADRKAGYFGKDHRARAQTCYGALIKESAEEGSVSFYKSEVAQAFSEFKKWMYREVYDQFNDIRHGLSSYLHDAYRFICRSPIFEDCNPAIVLALMTDREVGELVRIVHNKPNLKLSDMSHLGFTEIVPYLKGRDIDFTKVDLDPKKFKRQ